MDKYIDGVLYTSKITYIFEKKAWKLEWIKVEKKEEVEMDEERYVDIETKFDKVSHYASGRKYEPRKVIHDWDLNFNLGNVVKYVSRAGRKGEFFMDDLRKAKQYLEYEIEECQKKQ